MEITSKFYYVELLTKDALVSIISFVGFKRWLYEA